MTSKKYDYTVVPPTEEYSPAGATEIVLAVTVAVSLFSCVCCVLYCKGFFKRKTRTNQRPMPSYQRPRTPRRTQTQTPERMDRREPGDILDTEERPLTDLVPVASSEESLGMGYRTDNINGLPSLDNNEARSSTNLHVVVHTNDGTRSGTEEAISDRHDTTYSLTPPPLYHGLDRICPLVSTELQSPPSYDDFMAKPEIYTQVPR